MWTRLFGEWLSSFFSSTLLKSSIAVTQIYNSRVCMYYKTLANINTWIEILKFQSISVNHECIDLFLEQWNNKDSIMMVLSRDLSIYLKLELRTLWNIIKRILNAHTSLEYLSIKHSALKASHHNYAGREQLIGRKLLKSFLLY